MSRYIVAILAAIVLTAAGALAAQAPIDMAVESALRQELDKKKLTGVQAAVEDRVATLTGAVDKYTQKLDAEKKARKYKALNSVVNRIQVAGPSVADAELAEKLSRKLASDRSFQGNVFDAYWIQVRNGVVTLSGYAHNYPARDSALGIVMTEKGVKDVVNKVEVLPLSGFDDDIRVMAVRSIYGRAGMGKYAMDPAHPIRVIVRNGNVRLEGRVISPMDRTIAGIAASSVPGVFSIQNNLRVGSEATM